MLNGDALGAELSRRSLLEFAKRMQPDYETPKHIQVLANLLEDLESGKIKRLALALPPRVGKSTLASALFLAWIMGRNPRREIILSGHSQELVSGFSRQAKNYVESPLWPFKKVELSEDSRAIHRWNTKDGGGLFAVGVGGGITGRGADFLVVDDSVDRPNQADLDNAYSWFKNIAYPRTNANAKVLVIGARMASDDLFGHLQNGDDKDEWTFVSLPAINTENSYGLPVGQPLWPERFGLDELKQRREAMGLGSYSSQFLQDPSISAGSGLFRAEAFGEWETLPTATARPWGTEQILLAAGYENPLSAARPENHSAFVKLSAIDCAGVDNVSTGGSYTAIVTVLADLRTGEVYVLDCERWRNLAFDKLRMNIIQHLGRHAPNSVTVEINDPTGGRIFESLKGMTPYPVRGFKPRTSKVERATMVVGFVESGKCFLKARAVWKDMLLSELSSFGPNAKFSDMTDCLVMCLLASRQHVAARREDDYFEQSMKGFSLFNR